MYTSAASASTRTRRISKACENCRTRRTKCEPPYPCKACITAGLDDCQVRERARPNRQSRGSESSDAIRGTTPLDRIGATHRVERELERVYLSLTGQTIHLGRIEGHTHPALDLSTPLPLLPRLTLVDDTVIDVFIAYCLPMCSVLTPARVRDLYHRYKTAASTLSPDQIALVFMFLASGYARYHYFGERGREAHGVPEASRQDVAWYRHAVDTLTHRGSASFTSLHALCVMWFYTTTVCTLQTSRFVTGWMINQARELGLHRKTAASSATWSPTDRADYIWFLILYAHSYSVGLTGASPLLRSDEFVTMLANSETSSRVDEPESVHPRQAVVDLTILTNRLLMDLHSHDTPCLTSTWLLSQEEQWNKWLRGWSITDRSSGRNRIDPFGAILWSWGRMLMRNATLDDERYTMSSIAIMARSASQILARYNDWYSAENYNLAWQHLQHIVTCAHVTLFCHIRQELLAKETETNLASALWILGLAEPRWTSFARVSRERIQAIGSALGLNLVSAEPVTEATQNVAVPNQAEQADQSGPGYNAADPFYHDFDASDMFGPSSFDFLFTADATFDG